MLLAWIAVLVVSVHGLADFENDVSNFTFIYHDSQRLLLAVRNMSCYFIEVDITLQQQLSISTQRGTLEEQVIQAIQEQDSSIRATTLSAMRERYQDRLADFHCLDKNIFTFEIQEPSTTTPSAPGDCKDNVIYDYPCHQIPKICQDRFSFVCRRFCGICGLNYTHQTLPPSPGCVDRVGDGLKCQLLPGICNDPLGPLFCPQSCGHCPATQTTVSSATSMQTTASTITSTPTTATTIRSTPTTATVTTAAPTTTKVVPSTTSTTVNTLPPPSTTSTASSSECSDHLVNGKHCQEIPGICVNGYGRLACSRSCGVCTGPTPAVPTDVTAAPGACLDFLGGRLSCLQLPGVCNDASRIGPLLLCPKSCGVCHPPTTTPAPSNTCVNHIIHDYSCNQIPHMCTSHFSVICGRFCGVCAATEPDSFQQPSPSHGCTDRLGNGLTCQQLPGICQDVMGQLFCPRHCKTCSETTTTTMTSSSSAPATSHNSTCVNDADDDICSLPGFCGDPYGQGLCKKTCGLCNAGCKDYVDCSQLVGPGKTFHGVTALCSDPLRADLCQQTCGCP